MSLVTVLGATGNTGRIVTEALLAAGHPVRAVARSKDALRAFEAKGAEVASGDANDADFLARAFDSAGAVYTLLPPNFGAPDFPAYQDQVGESIVDALRRTGVPRVVFLSSIGADKESGTGPIAGLHAQEQRLATLDGVHVLSLRPGYFFENQYGNLGLIKSQGVNGSAIRGDVPFVQIAARDIGRHAAQALLELDWTGKSFRELRGPQDLTFVESTHVLGAALGKPDLQYVQFPYEAALEAMMGAGLARSVAEGYVEMSKAFNEGLVEPLQERTPQTTGATTFEAFAQELAGAYAAL